MGLISKKILGVSITTESKDNILENIKKYLDTFPISGFQFPDKRIKPFIIFTPNPEIITYAQHDDKFKQIVNSAQINIPDGNGVCWALAKKHHMSVPAITGTDFLEDLSKLAESRGFRIGIIGGRGGVALHSLKCLKKRYSNLKGWAMEGLEIEIRNSKFEIRNKSQNLNDQIEEIARKIMREKTNILFVALGFPKQEYFIEQVKSQKLKVKSERPLVMMAVGGALDYISQRVPRAPSWMRKRGLEWLYRLIQEPSRLTRQIKGAEFFYRVMTSSF